MIRFVASAEQKVLIHCRAGRNRSPAVAAVVMAAWEGRTWDESVLHQQFSFSIIVDFNTISLERGPRGEWGPGSARARTKLQFRALDARARTQDPFHSEDPFQRKLRFSLSCLFFW